MEDIDNIPTLPDQNLEDRINNIKKDSFIVIFENKQQLNDFQNTDSEIFEFEEGIDIDEDKFPVYICFKPISQSINNYFNGTIIFENQFETFISIYHDTIYDFIFTPNEIKEFENYLSKLDE